MVLDPRANPFFRGHEGAVNSLIHAVRSGRLHHGWLLAGPPGIGKATLAYRFGRWLLAGGQTADLSVPESSGVFRRVAAGTHPDFFTVERRVNAKTEKLQGEIVIATIQEASAFMRLTPAEGGWRVVVVDGAEDMNPNAANALLKLLEEPPPRAILLLVSAAPGRLLPTIRSRCRILPMAPLPSETMLTLLQEYAPELEQPATARLIDLSEGSIGNALSLAAGDGVALAALVDEALDAPVKPARAQAMADSVTRTVDGTDRFELFFSLLRTRLATRTRALARAGAGGMHLSHNVTLWQDFGKLEREVLGLNLDKRAAILVALEQLHRS
ncbi:DNA polymerase III subunit delta' [Acidocella aminolytica]|uniref:DNA polymerase III subunit delta n=1 Tax=Acidocella aminolytica 101 = DSM 11237 TaxID=1120923 RepID=A0A0D6PDI3_9PROT|nr:DNA polymerase III subunit delta' [Acidocella aminolytica]GAN79416.1 DNA polymerase III subunit delta' [Acidocella aminolytica 101 = DSM 11237]GBQ43871.1 DNA polymerase III subunit delta' [Acidocella aminolytica 101 = DSM 11237]SHE45399.1 DNA polymerase-3 subunit delta' [Acidocella aminolytica 101 = DSM 11237]